MFIHLSYHCNVQESRLKPTTAYGIFKIDESKTSDMSLSDIAQFRNVNPFWLNMKEMAQGKQGVQGIYTKYKRDIK